MSGLADLTELESVGPLDRQSRRIGGTMLYTSGTIGRPKGVLKSRQDVSPEEVLHTRLPLIARRYGWPIGDGVQLLVAPLYHAAPNGLALSGLHRGHSLVVIASWRPEECLELIQRHRVTSSHTVPTMFHRMLSLPEQVRARYEVSSLAFLIHAGAPCPAREKTGDDRLARAYGVPGPEQFAPRCPGGHFGPAGLVGRWFGDLDADHGASQLASSRQRGRARGTPRLRALLGV